MTTREIQIAKNSRDDIVGQSTCDYNSTSLHLKKKCFSSSSSSFTKYRMDGLDGHLSGLKQSIPSS